MIKIIIIIIIIITTTTTITTTITITITTTTTTMLLFTRCSGCKASHPQRRDKCCLTFEVWGLGFGV